jgi:hypothetical protein
MVTLHTKEVTMSATLKKQKTPNYPKELKTKLALVNRSARARRRAAAQHEYGVDNHVRGDLHGLKPSIGVVKPTGNFAAKLQEAIDHLENVEYWWNKLAKRLSLPLLNVEKAVNRLKDRDYQFFASYFDRADDDGVLHETQIITVLKIFHECIKNPHKSGLILGALQSGKTLVGIASQWLGPVYFLMTGRKVKPIYLTTNQFSHEDQTRNELNRFLSWYGDIELVSRERPVSCSVAEYRQMLTDHERFYQNPTLLNYRREVIGHAEFGDFTQADFLFRRVRGKNVNDIARVCGKGAENGIEAIPFFDESQVGASDVTGKRCVLRQILDAVEAQLEGKLARYIAISATPWGLFGVSGAEPAPFPNCWRVHMALTEDYVGFNYFLGEAIDPDKKIRTPDIFSFADFGARCDIPLLRDDQFEFTMWAMQHKDICDETIQKRFRQWQKAKRWRLPSSPDADDGGTYEEYTREYEDALRTLIDRVVEYDREILPGRKTPGFCIRLCNDNTLTRKMIDALDLDPSKVEWLEFTGAAKIDHKKPAGSVKRFLETERKSPHLPFVMFVTNKARMGDAFPHCVRYFLECTIVATTLNSLLQGLLGRACGYNKETTVILSRQNTTIIQDWMNEKGRAVYHTCRHSIVTEMLRGPQTNMMKLTKEMPDPVVQTYLRRVTEAVMPMVKQGVPVLTTERKWRQTRMGPILKIAEEMDLFNYLEHPEVQKKLFPNFSRNMEIARPNAELPGYDNDGHPRVERYHVDADGNCSFTFRHSESARGGRGGRGKHAAETTRDSKTDRARVDGKLEPQINVEKYNSLTGESIDDRYDSYGNRKDRWHREAGNWRIHMITLPLVQPVQELIAGKAVYPVSTSPYSRFLTDDQRQDRDSEEAGLAARKEKRRRGRAA